MSQDHIDCIRDALELQIEGLCILLHRHSSACFIEGVSACNSPERPSSLRHAASQENTQRICKAAEGQSPAERRRQAESERHKGNDYFRAQDYRAAVEAFTVATELDPQSVAARANRAAAYLKLRMWSDAETDASVVLQQEPGHLKAKLRRAQARSEMGQMSLAREDALAVLEQVCHSETQNVALTPCRR